MPRIDAVKERLDKVPGILKRFRQSVLTAARKRKAKKPAAKSGSGK